MYEHWILQAKDIQLCPMNESPGGDERLYVGS